MTSFGRFLNKIAYFRALKPLFILLMNRNYHLYSLSSLLQQISYFKNHFVILTIYVKIDVILGENDVIWQNNVIFIIDNRVHRLAN